MQDEEVDEEAQSSRAAASASALSFVSPSPGDAQHAQSSRAASASAMSFVAPSPGDASMRRPRDGYTLINKTGTSS